MTGITGLDKVGISARSHRLLVQLLAENPTLRKIMKSSHNEIEALVGVRHWVRESLGEGSPATQVLESEHPSRAEFEALAWRDYAAIRILDYIENAGRTFEDRNLRGDRAISNPFKLLWLAVTRGTGGAKPSFFVDMIELFRQLRGASERTSPDRAVLEEWMHRYPSGLDSRIIHLREENRSRIIRTIVRRIDEGLVKSSRYCFEPGLSEEQKYLRVLGWWDTGRFHLALAARTPDDLNEMLGNSLDPDTMRVLYEARDKGIPFFVNPYYLSLLQVRVPYFAVGADMAIRDYVFYSQQLVDEFGDIVAWEKEDQVEVGRPNAAGWLLPAGDCVHRRYPEVAILIPDTQGRACGGLCASCQRMFDFQRGHLNFNLDELRPRESWPEKLHRLLAYFEHDAQLRDILITGGDALMSSDRALAEIFDAICEMASRKREANRDRPVGEMHAEIVRVRLGTRLPVYLPQRITPELTNILREFREKALAVGVGQFLIQTHFESPMEVTPEARQAVERLLSAGWIVTNQHVFTAAASRRGHAAKLRQVLGEIGVLPYYTFTVKGYRENFHNFAPNARAVQEQLEEKVYGLVPEEESEATRELPDEPERMAERIADIEARAEIPFLATDRNVLNLPGVGKSLTFRVIGITRYGRRILEFDHDGSRNHSPIIDKLGKMVIVESKSISEYLRQLQAMGEDPAEYDGIWGYSIGVTEPRSPLYEYPEYDYEVTDELTNLVLENEDDAVPRNVASQGRQPAGSSGRASQFEVPSPSGRG